MAKLTADQKTQLEKFRERLSELSSEIDNMSMDLEENETVYEAMQDSVAMINDAESSLLFLDDDE